jgi:hypothetical protein
MSNTYPPLCFPARANWRSSARVRRTTVGEDAAGRADALWPGAVVVLDEGLAVLDGGVGGAVREAA